MVQIQAHSILIGFDIDSLLNRTISALGNIFIDALRLSLRLNEWNRMDASNKKHGQIIYKIELN